MAKVLSERTAEWIKKQINSRDLRARKRTAVIAGSGRSSSSDYVIATITNSFGGGIYSVSYESSPGETDTTTTEYAIQLANNLVTSSEYNTDDKILLHKQEFNLYPGGIE